MWKEFKEFISKGNVVDLAIGLIMGSAFTAIVKAVVDGILMPIISGLTAGVDYEDIVLNFFGAKLQIGNVINAIITFLIISLFLFIIVKTLNKTKKEEVEEETTKICPHCKSEIDIEATRCPHCTSKLEGFSEEIK
ncbi:large conductance mechanosensitive channel protein MscL [Anaerococcus hydrogenalis]|uniref:Large-conductance mechanosensitive channel n=2 Tax=Anaerococcus hydrogenalis TaxID=33029 RepID=B6W639_9FIRM|nr:large conductance mechanosensitive channel protein MscL [Anaerococcus hydrogenalis]EEB37109.1 large conductance mechanosensitive channel protein [Anaerococcus hydrogenalis DSM 7454]MDK7695010.1 large conductance mechanosensitive channel protein MscL [Anaerococcus hydrogenalis]MDK7697636.1 large conductance mechanosensitive channel protein MscL [Anaerococcus hydrogenalis]MDK7708037.1 large conductance mechanosensitive channel protein MscL [Anaerococcus hydrogenalis]PMC82004.1 large conductan